MSPAASNTGAPGPAVNVVVAEPREVAEGVDVGPVVATVEVASEEGADVDVVGPVATVEVASEEGADVDVATLDPPPPSQPESTGARLATAATATSFRHGLTPARLRLHPERIMAFEDRTQR